MREKKKMLVTSIFSFSFVLFFEDFLAPLAKGQQAIVMALCPPCIGLFVHLCICKLFLKKTSPQKLLTGILLKFTGMLLRGSLFKFLQIIVFHKKSGCHGNQSKKLLKIFSSQTTNWIALLFCRNVP